MLATSRAGYPTEVQLELVVVALAWGDVLMNTCCNGNRMQSARHTWYIDAAHVFCGVFCHVFCHVFCRVFCGAFCYVFCDVFCHVFCGVFCHVFWLRAIKQLRPARGSGSKRGVCATKKTFETGTPRGQASIDGL